MSISSSPIDSTQPSEQRIAMEATTECVATLRLFAKHAQAVPTLQRSIRSVASTLARVPDTRHPFQPGETTSAVAILYENISDAMATLAGQLRDRQFVEAAESVVVIRKLVTSVAVLLQV